MTNFSAVDKDILTAPIPSREVFERSTGRYHAKALEHLEPHVKAIAHSFTVLDKAGYSPRDISLAFRHAVTDAEMDCVLSRQIEIGGVAPEQIATMPETAVSSPVASRIDPVINHPVEPAVVPSPVLPKTMFEPTTWRYRQQAIDDLAPHEQQIRSSFGQMVQDGFFPREVSLALNHAILEAELDAVLDRKDVVVSETSDET